MEANTEIKKYEETIQRLFQMLKRVCQERDEAKDKLQQLQTKFQPSIKSRITRKADITPKSSTNYNSYDLSLASCEAHDENSSIGFSCNFALPKKPAPQEKTEEVKADIGSSKESVSQLMDKLVWGKTLPQKGRLLRSVTEAGPLLSTLLIAPTPQWKNPPPFSADFEERASVNLDGATVPTSLSLAFPGKSHVSSESGFGSESRKNDRKRCLDVDSNYMMQNHMIIGKKRKLL